MEILFPKVDIKSTKLSEVKAGQLFVENLGNINDEKSYQIKIGFPEKNGKSFSIFVLNESNPTVFKKDMDRQVYVVGEDIIVDKNASTSYLNSVKQQSIFVFEDSSYNLIYMKTDKTKDQDCGLLVIGRYKEDAYEINFSGSGGEIVYKEGDRKIRTLSVQFELNFE